MVASGQATTRPGAAPHARAASAARGRRFRLHRLSALVLVVGAAASIGLGVSARISYDHTEAHLTMLQTKLTASSLGVAQVDLERRLGEALNRAYGTPDPGPVFAKAIRSSMAPTGPFVSAALQLLRAGHVHRVAALGGKPIADLHSRPVTALFEEAARTDELVTTHVVGDGQQRLIYLLAVPGGRGGGTLVGGASQPLPANRRIVVPPSSPDAGLWIAIYFGATTTSAGLLETNAPRTPLTGTTAKAEIPFGNNVLTLVASPRSSLDGAWSEAVPWGILGVGLVFTVAIAAMTERLLRRRLLAEALAVENRALYREQRDIAVTLQRAVLPKQLPQVPGVELAARYLPGAAGVEVGGDWYSAIRSGETTFAFVVGDVAGKGVEAATAMATLRYTIRTLAALGFPPGAVLETTARELHATGEERFATVLVGTVDTATRTLALASAGHLPPLLVTGGEAGFLEVPVGPPLGVVVGPYETATLVLPPGATLLGYTDGLVERRSELLDDGLERLRKAVEGHEGAVDGLLVHLLDELGAAKAEDDIAVLGVRLAGARPVTTDGRARRPGGDGGGDLRP